VFGFSAGICGSLFTGWGLGSRVGVLVLGFEVWGLGFGVWGLGFGVWGSGFGAWGLSWGFRVFGFEFRNSGSGIRLFCKSLLERPPLLDPPLNRRGAGF